jgi:uncharacterized protein YraI
MLYLKRFAVAAAALGLTATAALARPAVSETDLNVRAGPGTNFAVVGVLQEGESANVSTCSGSWCRVNFAGGSGWASANYLSMGGSVGYAAPPAVVYDDPYYYDDGYYAAPGIAFGYYGSRHRWGHHRHRGNWAHRGGRGDGRWSGRGGRSAGVIRGGGRSGGGSVFRGPRAGGDTNVGVIGGSRGGVGAGASGGSRGGGGPSGGRSR